MTASTSTRFPADRYNAANNHAPITDRNAPPATRPHRRRTGPPG